MSAFTHRGWFGICPVYLGRPDYEPAWPIQVTGRLPTPIPFESI